MYAEKMGAFYTDSIGAKKPLWLASYGIGPTRVLGTLVEIYNDEKGIIWPESVAPYEVHLIEIQNSKLKTQNYNSKLKNLADDVYEKLQKAGIEVLFDDRDVSTGQKFADADLIGIPVRLVSSSKTGKDLEWKKRNEDKTEILDFDEVLRRLRKD